MKSKPHIAHMIPAHPVFYKMTEFWINQFSDFDVHVYFMKKASDQKDYVFSNNSISLVEYNNSLDLAKKILDITKQSEKVYIHAIFFNVLVKLWLLILGFQRYIYKLIWIEWGFDLYFWDNSSLRQIIKSLLVKLSIYLFEKRFPFFIAIHPADIKSYYKIIGGKAKVFFAPYTSMMGSSQILIENKKLSMQYKMKLGEPIVIQIGHRADHILNHKDTLLKLSRFADKNIKLLLPLSYGDENYKNEIIQFAKNLYSDKVLFLTNSVPYDDYIRNLKSVDIFILNSKRQIALGNLNPMIILEKKIVLPRKSVLYDYLKPFTPIMSYEELDTCSYGELIRDVDMKEARAKIIEYKNLNPVECWNTIFHEISPLVEKVE